MDWADFDILAVVAQIVVSVIDLAGLRYAIDRAEDEPSDGVEQQNQTKRPLGEREIGPFRM